jgi:hypothetical protein
MRIAGREVMIRLERGTGSVWVIGDYCGGWYWAWPAFPDKTDWPNPGRPWQSPDEAHIAKPWCKFPPSNLSSKFVGLHRIDRVMVGLYYRVMDFFGEHDVND